MSEVEELLSAISRRDQSLRERLQRASEDETQKKRFLVDVFCWSVRKGQDLQLRDVPENFNTHRPNKSEIALLRGLFQSVSNTDQRMHHAIKLHEGKYNENGCDKQDVPLELGRYRTDSVVNQETGKKVRTVETNIAQITMEYCTWVPEGRGGYRDFSQRSDTISKLTIQYGEGDARGEEDLTNSCQGLFDVILHLGRWAHGNCDSSSYENIVENARSLVPAPSPVL